MQIPPKRVLGGIGWGRLMIPAIALAAYVNALALCQYLGKITAGKTSMTRSVFALLAFCAIYLLLKAAAKRLNGRLAAISLVLALMYAAFMVLGSNLLMEGTGRYNNPSTYWRILALSPSFGALVSLALDRLSNLPPAPQAEAEARASDRKRFLAVFLSTFLLWLFFLLVAYPGIYAYDSVYQLHAFLHGLHAKHPIPHTLLLSSVLMLGKNVLGGYEAGMLLYSLLQMLILDYALTRVYIWASSRASARLRLLLLAAHFLYLPSILLSFSATKDVLFSAFFALLMLDILQIVEAPGEFLASRRRIVAFAAVMLLACAFRNNAIYAVAPFMLILAAALRKHWKAILLPFLCVALLHWAITAPLYKALNIAPPPAAEALSVPIQQLSRVASLHAHELTPDELETVEEFIPNYKAYDITSRISDRVKNSLNHAAWDERKREFIVLWLRVGFRCPMAYLDSFLNTTMGYWYIDMISPDQEAYHPYLEYRNFSDSDNSGWILIERTSLFPALDARIQRFVEEGGFQAIPGYAVALSSAFALWAILLLAAAYIYRRSFRYLLPCFFAFLYLLTLFLGPVALFRYVYPLVISLPILAGGLLSPANTQIGERRSVGSP